jgi:hypothetical protein
LVASQEKLKELSNVFTLIITNEDVKSLEENIKQRIIEQSLYAKELVNICQEAISLTVSNTFSKDLELKFL